MLRGLRNSIEHLNEAALTEDFARKDPEGRRHQSIDTLPNSELFLGGVPADLVESVFGELPLESLVARARQHACVDVPDEQGNSTSEGQNPPPHHCGLGHRRSLLCRLTPTFVG